ncbi:hypothetical protein HK096_010612, partial [Nowakowskiella sp. JEL0078]
MSAKFTFYTSANCPYAQRAAITLSEIGASFEKVEIDLKNKPDWYHTVNPELKVPALKVGESDILTESLVISEYLAESYPDSDLTSTSALERAHSRWFITYFADRFKY